MSHIKVMSESLANKIAAGEVVERCSSIVKELCENSIDAKSKNIIINLKRSGKDLIEVIDDGIGMSHEDALMCFKRHATSKLLKEDDLFFIDTLGFRGEALPSIASVSNVLLKTSDGEVGTSLELIGGNLTKDQGSDLKRGTSIKITNLFYNTPARLKYLKSDQYELSSIVSLVERLALSHPNISFTLNHEDKNLLRTSGNNDLLKTIHEIFGLQVSSNMLSINASSDDYDISGYVCKPEVLKSTRNYMIIMVNNRVVRNYDILNYINEAYYNYKPDSKYPFVVINIYTDPTLVDVNIHPTKQEVKLSKINVLKEMLIREIRRALDSKVLAPDVISRLSNKNIIKESFIMDNEKKEQNHSQITMDLNITNDLETKEEVEEVNRSHELKKLIPLCQIHKTFIVCVNDEGMYLVDQHAAAERINYELVKEEFQNRSIKRQSMLIPITIELSSSDFIKIKENMAFLDSLGITVEEFGINTIVIKETPTWLKTGYEEETLRAVIDNILNDNNMDQMAFLERTIQTISCKMSIKANMDLSKEAMQVLLDRLILCKNPFNCAHGRPSIIKFSNYDLDRMFKRVMN